MTIQNNGTRNQYTATSGQTIFPYTFEIFASGDLTVEQNGSVITAYTVSGVGNDAGGNVTLDTGATTGDVITIYRDMDLERLTDYQNNGDFLASEVNDDYDRIWAGLQQLQTNTQAALRPSASDTALNSSNTELADIATRGGKTLGFKATGELEYFSTAVATGDLIDTPTESTMTALSGLTAGVSVVVTAEKSIGVGGGARWDTVTGTGTANGDDRLAHDTLDMTFVRRDDTRIEQKVDGIEGNLGDVATISTDEGSSFTNPGDIVLDPITTNKADPDVADEPETADVAPTPMATTADYLHRLRNTGTGATSAQSSSTLGTFAVSPKWDVDPSTQYTISMHNAPLGWEFYQVSAQIQEFDALGEHIGNIVPTSVSFNDRQATFTTTASAAKISINLRNSVDFSNSDPLTATSYEECVDNIMLNTGATAQPFAPFSDGDFTPTSALFNPTAPGQISVSKQGEFFYIRTKAQQSTSKDVVWRVLVNHGVNRDRVDSRSGVVDFYGIRFIDSSSTETKAAFNKSTDVHNAGMDESTPIRLNSMFLAGGHGVVGWTANQVAHGKAQVDVGSIWSDGTDQWVMYYINDVDNVTFVRKNTGTADKWIISSNDFGSGTLTHVSGATNTGNITIASSTQYQFVPIIRDYLAELRIDDTAITANGDYTGQRVVLSETYALLNMASQQDNLIANVGSVVEGTYTENAVTEQVRFYYEYEWNEFGAMSVRTAYNAYEAFRRSTNDDYWGGIQLQRVSLSGDSTGGMSDRAYVYIPEIAPVSGLDFEAIAEVTSNAAEIRAPRSSCDNPNDPASHYCLIGRASDGTTDVTGHLFGYSREELGGIPATRATLVDNIYRISSAEKNYPYVIDSEQGDASPGEKRQVTCFRAPFLPTDTTLTVPAVIATMTDATYCYITSHQNHTNKSVSIPSKFNGWPVTTVKSSPNVTIHSSYVSNGSIEISVTNNYGDVVLRLGSEPATP